MNDDKWLYKDLTEKIIGAVLEVHKTLGPGFLEYVYEEALCYELTLRKIPFERQTPLDIIYKDLLIPKKYIPDLLIDKNIVVELKAMKALTDNEEAILLNYLKGSKKRVGLLFNFGSNSLEIKRRVF